MSNTLITLSIFLITILLSVFLLIISFVIKAFFYTINEISDRIFGTQFNKKGTRVRFGADTVKTYILTNEERQMKKDAYRRICINERKYRRKNN